MEVLKELYHQFFQPTSEYELKADVEKNHKKLIKNLSRKDRRKLLKIIDSLTMMSEIRSEESFICEFNIAMNIKEELKCLQ